MSTPESIAAAFARGLVEGMLGAASAAPEAPAPPAPIVVPVADVREAVADFLRPLIEADGGEPEQTDLFSPPGDMGDAILRRVAEARERAAAADAADDVIPPGSYDPNSPAGGTPWSSPL